MKKIFAAALAVSLVAAPVQAGAPVFEAVPAPGATVVQWMGAPRIQQSGDRGVVSVTPRGLEHGRLAFDVEVQNRDQAAAFFGRENIFVSTDDRQLALLSDERVQQVAGQRRAWTQIGIALATVALVGVAAAVAGGGPANVGNSYFFTPSARRKPAEPAGPPPAMLASVAAAPLQSTSIPSRHIYRGRILVDRPRGASAQELSLLVNFHGEQYPFTFRMSRG